MMTVLITLSSAGADTGPFDLYSNHTGIGVYTLFESGVSKAALLLGYQSEIVPDGTTFIQICSTGVCENCIVVPVSGLPEPTTTTTTSSSTSTSTSTTSTSTSTTTSTTSSTTTTTTTLQPVGDCYHLNIPDAVLNDGVDDLYIDITIPGGSLVAYVYSNWTDMDLEEGFYDFNVCSETAPAFRYGPVGEPENLPSIIVTQNGACYDDSDCIPTTTTTSTTTMAPLYTYYITNSTNEGCGNSVGTTEYFAYEAAPNAVTAFSTSDVQWVTYSPGAGTLGWSLNIGPVQLAEFHGTIDIDGNITVEGVCNNPTTSTTTTTI